MNTGSVSKTTASSSASSKGRRKSPPRPDPDRIRSTKAPSASGGSSGAVRSLHSHGTGGAGAGRRLEDAGGHSDSGGGVGGSRSTATGCSGGRNTGPGPNRRRISTDSMRGDRLKADQIKFNNVKFDTVKFGHQVPSHGGNKSVVIWDPSPLNPSSPSRRGSFSGSTFGTSNRFQSMSTKSTASYVIPAPPSPERQFGHASVTTSGTGGHRHASMTSYKARSTQPHVQTSTSSVAERPSQSSVVVLFSKGNHHHHHQHHQRRREESAVVSISDSMVRTSPGVFRMLNAPSKIHSVSSKVWARQLSATAATESESTVSSCDVHGPQIYGKVCRKEGAAGTRDPVTQDGGGGGFRQICSSASYTLVLDRMQRERASEHSAASRATAAADYHRKPLQPSDASKCKPGTAVAADTEKVSSKVEKEKSAPSEKNREVRTETGGSQKKRSCENVATKPGKAPSESELTAETSSPSSSSVHENGSPKLLEEDNAIVCVPCSSSVVCGGPSERREVQEDRVLPDSETTMAAGGGTAKSVRLTKPSCVSETQAVDHFRLKLSEERATTTTLRRRLGAVRKDLSKCRTDLRREEELRRRTEQWSEYLEQELSAYVRSRAEAEKRYLNLLQVVRGIDRFTKQLLHKYVALHRKVEPGRQRLASDNPFQIHRASRSHVSSAGPGPSPAATPTEKEDSLRSDAVAAVRSEPAAEAGDKCPPLSSSSTEENDHSLDHLSNDDYDFITKYLKASASLPEANVADVDSVGLYPEADECDTEANWSSNNFISFREASRSLDEMEAADGHHQDKSIVHVLESDDHAAAGVVGEIDGDEDAECAGDNQGTKNFDVRLRRLGKFFDQVVRICRRKPEAYFRLLADKSCLLADEIRLSVEERKRRNVRSERRRRWQNGDIVTKDYIFQVRSHGAGDLAEGTHIDMENANGCHEHVSSDFEDEVDWEDEEEEEDEEQEEEEKLWQQEEGKRKKIEEEEKKQLEEKREKRLEEKRLEEKRREEKRIEQKKLEEKKREEKRREEKRIEEKKLEEQRREEKKREEKRIEEKKLEEQRREEKKREKRIEEEKLEEQKREEKKREEKRIEEKKLEEQKREEKKREEKRIEEKKLEEKKLEEQKREEKKLEEQRREEKKREERKREEKKLEEQKREEQKREEKKREEKKIAEKKLEEQKREEKRREEKKREDEKEDDNGKLKSASSESFDQGVDAAPLPQTPKADEEAKASAVPSGHKEKHIKDPEEKAAAAGLDGAGEDRLAPPTGVQREYIKRLLKEMCHYCDRYRPGDRAAGLKAFLRDTIEAEFL